MSVSSEAVYASSASRLAGRTTLIYVVAGGLWIVFSDLGVFLLSETTRDALHLQTLKGWMFVAVTGAVLYVALRHQTHTLAASQASLREHEVLLQAVLSSLSAHIAVLDADGDVIAVNAAWERFAREGGAGARTGVGTDYLAVCRSAAETGEPDVEPVVRGIRAVLDGRLHEYTHEYPCATPAGELWFAMSVTPLARPEGGAVVSHVDITERKRAEQALAASERRYRALYDDNPSMFFTVAPDGELLSVNRFGARELGFESGRLAGNSVFELFHPEDRGLARRMLERTFAEPTSVHTWELRKLTRGGGVVWARETAQAVETPDWRWAALVVSQDITEAHELSEELSYQASHDVVTGLPNRREFERRIAHALEGVYRAEDEEHALLYMDLDQFKLINDTCGHTAGDELLRQLSGLLAKRLRRGDTLARLGGDEFGVLTQHCTAAEATEVADALRQGVQEFRFAWEGRVFNVGVSIGVVGITRTCASVAELLAMADAACYAAKDAGRNRIRLYRETDSELAQRRTEMQWAARITSALEEDRFSLMWQPIAAVASESDGRLHGELLVRMREEGDGEVPPGAFLPAAERYNLSVALDRWVVGAAVAWLERHPQAARRFGVCSLNLSGLSLSDEQFLRFVLRQLDERPDLAHKLCFELTETAAIANLADAITFIESLRKRGCRFALDDFGTGLSSFAYLRTLPVDYLKIDGTFVKNIPGDPANLALVRSINEIGHVLGKLTIAEFVESTEILRTLHDIGVDYAQGYAIARPHPLDELLDGLE